MKLCVVSPLHVSECFFFFKQINTENRYPSDDEFRIYTANLVRKGMMSNNLNRMVLVNYLFFEELHLPADGTGIEKLADG